MQISKHKVATIDYTLTDKSSTVIDSSDGGEPLSYIHGIGNIIPGLEAALAGKNPGDTLKVSIPPADAYGERDPSLTQTVSRDRFESAEDIRVGMQFQAESEAGPMVVTVVDITDENVVVDGNHPLAGMTLNFDVKVLDVRDATEEELNHGHVHGPGGHHH